ncbi:hypothetical protein [Rhizobium hidalgonense]|uniref:hypothetical protein n=1 Tax=Rhizobium hidalgonense TaxID=1538159 RepID=UPI0028712D46|nr:hypothetical protein [Rhizobium hidalgonense]MDR9811273.1 hypothetical protein [Rhizobium hidalgonense]
MPKKDWKSGAGRMPVDDGQLSFFETADVDPSEITDPLDYAISDLVKTAFGRLDKAHDVHSISHGAEVNRLSVSPPPLASDENCDQPDNDFNREKATHPAIGRFPALAVHQSYELGSTKARLVDILNECLETNTMPRSERDRRLINRREMASRLNVSHTLLSSILRTILTDYEVALEFAQPVGSLPEPSKFGTKPVQAHPLNEAGRHVVSQYPNLSKHQHYSEKSTADKIVRILNAQIFAGGLKRSGGGKINRRLITTELGLHNTVYRRYRQIIEDYENEVGGKESVAETKIPAMRRWLEQQDRGTLLIRDGKVSRNQLFDEFDFVKTSTVLIRYPRVAELVQEFDKRVVETHYQPKEIGEKLRKLRELLEEPPVGKDGQTIDRTALATLLDLPPRGISTRPYIEFITIADEKLRDRLKNDPLLAFVGGRVFKFHSMVEQGWSHSFASRFKASFERLYRKRSKDLAKAAFAAATELLSFIAESGSQACMTLLDSLSNGVQPASLGKEFTLATQAYRDSLVGKYENVLSRNTKLTTTNSIIKCFSNDGILPPHELRLIAFREDNINHLRSVAEVTETTRGKVRNPHVDEYLNFATSMLKQAADVRQIEISGGDQSDFNKVLRAELADHEFKAAEDPAKVILLVLTRRLDLIKTAATKLLNVGRALWDRGRELLRIGGDPGDVFHDILRKGRINEHQRRQLLRDHFPNDDDSREQGIANLLRIVAERYCSIYPSNKAAGREEGQFFSKRAEDYGGSTLLQSYLLPTQEAVAAGITLYLLESGSNVSVGRTLNRDCIEPSEEPNHSKVTGYKARAGGKPIFVTLPDRCDAIKGMTWLKEAFAGNSKIVDEDRDQLFLCRGNGETLKLIEEWTFRAEFKRLTQSVPELADLPLTPNMLRPSILLKAALESDAKTGLSRAMGQHGAQVHEGYINKYPIMYLRDTDIRLFQHSMETVVIQKLEDVHAFLGVDEEKMAGRVEAVMRTGLGTMCADRYGKPGNEGKLCQSLDCVKGCPQLILIAIPKEIAILQLWQHSLRLVEGDWVRDQPERWEKVWLPWLCFCDAVEVKMRQSFSDVWSDATEISSKMLANPNFTPMRLF